MIIKIKYSNETGGFYDSEIHGDNIPENAVEITSEEYTRAMDWQANGGVIEGVDENGVMILKDSPQPSPEQVQSAKVALVQRHMDDAARARRYDNIANAITYADEPSVPKFQAEGIAFRKWRSLVWEKCYEVLKEVESGRMEIPSDEELISLLPVLELPVD